MGIATRGLLEGWEKQHALWLAIGAAVGVLVFAAPLNTWGQLTLPDPLVGTWEVPAAMPVQTFSGVVLFQGWTCDPAVMAVPARTVVEIQIGLNPRERTAVGTFRPDTNMSASGPCLGDYHECGPVRGRAGNDQPLCQRHPGRAADDRPRGPVGRGGAEFLSDRLSGGVYDR